MDEGKPERTEMPKVLLIATTDWQSTARLAMALAESGCRVEMVCRRNHPVRHTNVLAQRYVFAPMWPSASVEHAILKSRPDLVVSCDDSALILLYRIHGKAKALGQAGDWLRNLIERSVGDPAHFDTVLARSKMMELARQEGIAVPATAHVASPSELPNAIAQLGLPLVLKSDASAGGTGVRLVHRAGEAAKAWRRLRGPIGLARTVNRVLRDRDWTPILAYARRETRVVSAQKFIARPGTGGGEAAREGTMGVVCWQGKVLAAICLEVVQTWRVSGPSSVVRLIDEPEMIEAATKIAARLRFTGFCGFDFIFDSETGRPLLLEMNARPTQVCHLALGPGRDLTSALRCALLGVELRERPKITGNDLIALFPQEWQRDRQSPMLRLAYHDVPLGQPDLLRAGIRMHVNRGVVQPRRLNGLRGLLRGVRRFYTGADLR